MCVYKEQVLNGSVCALIYMWYTYGFVILKCDLNGRKQLFTENICTFYLQVNVIIVSILCVDVCMGF